MVLNKFFLFLIGTGIFLTTEVFAFTDDFHTNSISKYTKRGKGTLSYAGSAEQIHVTTAQGDSSLTFSRTVSAATAGIFNIDFRSVKQNGSHSKIKILLMQDAKTYYKITEREGSKKGGIIKYVNGKKVDSAWFHNGYEQNKNYTIRIEFSAASTTIDAFGETLIISNDNTPITVRSFSIETKQQNAYYDNIEYTVIQNDNITPATGASKASNKEIPLEEYSTSDNTIDDFHTNTISKYAKKGKGSLLYDSATQRAKAITDKKEDISFSHALPTGTAGTFSIDFRSIKRYSVNNLLEIRLIQDAKTYYKITSREGSKVGGITKYINGKRVDAAWSSKGYMQNKDYTVKIDFSATSTVVDAFGYTLIIDKDSTPITVKSFSVKTKEQNAYFDNIEYNVITKSSKNSSEAVSNTPKNTNDHTHTNVKTTSRKNGRNPYLEPITLPECDASNPEVQFIKNNSDWKMINSKNKRIFCVSPGDYRSVDIKITASGTASKKRYIVLNNGNDIHPGKLPLAQVANYALVFKQASYWVVDRMAGVSPHASRVVDFKGARGGTPGSGCTHNIINRLYTSNMGAAVRFGTDGDSNTLQNSRIENMRLDSRKKDVMAVIIEDNIEKTPGMTITNTKIINNEIVNNNDGIHVGRHNYTADGGKRQSGNIAGTIIDGNDIYITSDLYTDGHGHHDPDGIYAYAEDGMDIKIGSDDPNNPMIISNNHVWGFRQSDTTGSSISSYGGGIGTHLGVYNIKIINNVVFDTMDGIAGASGARQDEPYGMLNAEIKHNLLYEVGPILNRPANALRFSMSKNIDASENIIINSRDDYAMVASSKGDVCVGNNIIINQENGNNVENRNNWSEFRDGINQCLKTNAFYNSTAAAGYTKDYTFVTDKFTNSPRVMRLKNAVKPN